MNEGRGVDRVSRGDRGRVRGDAQLGEDREVLPGLGFRLEFETDHNSGQLRNGNGPYVFVAEVPPDQDALVQLVLKVADEGAFRAGPGVEVVTTWEDTHYGSREMIVRDPDGRLLSL